MLEYRALALELEEVRSSRRLQGAFPEHSLSSILHQSVGRPLTLSLGEALWHHGDDPVR